MYIVYKLLVVCWNRNVFFISFVLDKVKGMFLRVFSICKIFVFVKICNYFNNFGFEYYFCLYIILFKICLCFFKEFVYYFFFFVFKVVIRKNIFVIV